MLQQTRVAAVIPFYDRFMARFPNVEALAGAHEEDVLAEWAGLGYYSRARNMRNAAQQVVSLGGVFPSDRATLLALPGIGEYTAAAIGSIAFNLPLAAVDGNLLRVIARLGDDPSDIGNVRTRARFTNRAQAMLDRKNPGEFNQAMMELGATVCLPKSPRCHVCPVSAHCVAQSTGRQSELPVKARKQNKIHVEAVVLVIRHRGRILLCQRPQDAGQMAGFWELPEAGAMPEASVGAKLGEVRHTITHHHYRFDVMMPNGPGPPVSPWHGKT